MLRRGLPALLLAGMASIAGATPEDDRALQMVLLRRVEALQHDPRTSVQGARIASMSVLNEIYERRSFYPVWDDRRDVEDLLGAIDTAKDDGLFPVDYHAPLLRDLIARSTGPDATPGLRADLDLLLTDAALRLGYHLFFGKVDPESLSPRWNVPRTLGGIDPVEALVRSLREDDLRGLFERLRPQQAIYRNMREELGRHRALRDAGGWPFVPGHSTLKPGMTDARVAELRKRLAASGDIDPATAGDSPLFDDALVEGVRRFQDRHGLDADGVVGRATFDALNVPIERRIDEIRANLERGRWLLHDLGGDLVIVNVAGYKLYLLEQGSIAWETRVQVGKPYRKTPLFRAEMTYLVLNPDWTVPPTIFAEDMLPKLRKDPNFLEKRGLRVVDSRGKPVDASKIDWDSIPERGSPYYLRQDPSPDNALGRVKFMFPNPYTVFLHDTPNIAGFDKADRAVSSGCIRVEDPLELARRVLDDEANWNASAIQAAVDEGEARTVSLSHPIPVLLFYWTAAAEADGRMHFYRDVYGHDPELLRALAGEFVPRRRTRDR